MGYLYYDPIIMNLPTVIIHILLDIIHVYTVCVSEQLESHASTHAHTKLIMTLHGGYCIRLDSEIKTQEGGPLSKSGVD